MPIDFQKEGVRELTCLRYFCKHFNFTLVEQSTGYTPGWDAVIETSGGKRQLVEVKFDEMSKTTGNIAIEFHNSRLGVPSGLASTQSDIWLHAYHWQGEWWISATRADALKAKLRELRNRHIGRIVKGRGDGNADLFLIPVAHFRELGAHFPFPFSQEEEENQYE
jgi:hypothetical protein